MAHFVKLDGNNTVTQVIVVADSDLDAAVEAIQTAAHTGHIGDGKIFIYDIDEAIRIRTGERGSEAV